MVERLAADADDGRRALQEALAAIPREADPPSALGGSSIDWADESTSRGGTAGADDDVALRQVRNLHSFIARRFDDLERRMDALEAMILDVAVAPTDDQSR